MLGWSNKLLLFFGMGGGNHFLSHESSSGLEVRLPAKFQPPEKIASCVWILSRWLGGWVVGWWLGCEEQ